MHQIEKGSVVVEFALLITLLLTITFGITELGRAMYCYNSLVKTARDATRYLSVQSPGDNAEPGGLTTFTVAKNLAVYGNPSGQGNPIMPGLTTTMIYIYDSANDSGSVAQGTNPPINLVTVKIKGYKFFPIVPINFLSPNSVSEIDFALTNDISVTMRQVL